jgi:hypothetical protein
MWCSNESGVTGVRYIECWVQHYATFKSAQNDITPREWFPFLRRTRLDSLRAFAIRCFPHRQTHDWDFTSAIQHEAGTKP